MKKLQIIWERRGKVVTRMLKYFQNEGIVTINRGIIEIKDEEKLYRIVEN